MWPFTRTPQLQVVPPPQAHLQFDGVPLAVGSVYGIRQWRLGFSDHLMPLHVADEMWRDLPEGGQFVASCWTCARAGRLNCGCGFYAYYSTENFISGTNVVSGIVQGSGIVTLGALGFRAEKARIKCFIESNSGKAITDYDFASLRERYQVPIFGSVRKATKKFPLGAHRE